MSIAPIPFGRRFIGPGYPVVIVAEIGINHEGNVEVCKNMVTEALRAGADAVKLQTIDPDENYDPQTASYRLFRRARLTQDETRFIFDHARSLGIEVFTTVGDFKTLSWVEKLAPAAYKISSGLLTHLPLIEALAKTGRSVLMSTGIAKEAEIDEAVATVLQQKNCNIGLFHCVSLYPTPEDKINLRSIEYLQTRYSLPVGLSDHSTGWETGGLAVTAGACAIEKHFSLDPSRKEFDHHLSLDPDGFLRMVTWVRRAEKIFGEKRIESADAISPDSTRLSRRIVARVFIGAGHTIEPDHLGFMRSDSMEAGLAPKFVGMLIGRKAVRDLERFSIISLEDTE